MTPFWRDFFIKCKQSSPGSRTSFERANFANRREQGRILIRWSSAARSIFQRRRSRGIGIRAAATSENPVSKSRNSRCKTRRSVNGRTEDRIPPTDPASAQEILSPWDDAAAPPHSNKEHFARVRIPHPRLGRRFARRMRRGSHFGRFCHRMHAKFPFLRIAIPARIPAQSAQPRARFNDPEQRDP